MVATGNPTFEFFEDLEKDGLEIPSELVAEYNEFLSDYAKHEGLLPSGSVPDILGLSKQRWSQLNAKYKFWSAEYFDKKWYSRREIEDFYNVERKTGRPKMDAAKVLKGVLPALKMGE